MNTHETHSTLTQAEMPLMRHCPLVTCGQEVKRGERIATSSTPGMGDIHTPVAGKVAHVDTFRIRIDANGDEQVDPVSLDDLSGSNLLITLLELGADLPQVNTTETLIINGVDAEQGVLTRQELFISSRATLERGLKTAVALYNPQTTILAALKGTAQTLDGANTVDISEQYPSGLDPMVALAVTGREAPENTVVIGLETLFQLGRIMETGLPIMETMITVGKEGKIVSLGTPVGQILDEAGEVIADRDRIVLGGVLRGAAAASPSHGVGRDTSAVALVNNPAPVAQDAPCVGCGECVRKCPARLDPSMITSYAEFGMYDKAAAEDVDVCFECGLCGFFCIARRPMLQYIRLAKNELALAQAQSGEEV